MQNNTPTPLPLGSVVFYAPTMQKFALYSGSWVPSSKMRPCFISSHAFDGTPFIIPLLGAVAVSGQWSARRGVNARYWQPVQYVNTRYQVQVPRENLAEPQRPAIVITANPNIPPPKKSQAFKPGYIWVGDIGEAITPDKSSNVMLVQQYMVLTPDQLQLVAASANYWNYMGLAPRNI